MKVTKNTPKIGVQVKSGGVILFEGLLKEAISLGKRFRGKTVEITLNFPRALTPNIISQKGAEPTEAHFEENPKGTRFYSFSVRIFPNQNGGYYPNKNGIRSVLLREEPSALGLVKSHQVGVVAKNGDIILATRETVSSAKQTGQKKFLNIA